MSEINCFYHPKRNAIKKCEFCGKSICIGCRKEHRKEPYPPRGDTVINLNRKKTYCPVCYHLTIINEIKGKKQYMLFSIPFFCLFLLLGILVFLVFLNSPNGSSLTNMLIFGIGLIAFPFFVILGSIHEILVNNPKKIRKAEINLEKFIKETRKSTNIVFENPVYNGKF